MEALKESKPNGNIFLQSRKTAGKYKEIVIVHTEVLLVNKLTMRKNEPLQAKNPSLRAMTLHNLQRR